ncbi:MAG: glycerol-3-phosphate acyltransferase [Anaerolineae bacterium]|nr:glycerol-3-phosphate acyltransferase [Anaerolineae bacterium]
MSLLLWIPLSFLCGALPLSVWVGKLALGVDIRQFGDGNPGATNVFRAGGKGWGIVALLLDCLKGLLPVALANFGGYMEGWALAAIATAPIAGHAFSPFLGWRGGKALAVTFGVWTGLSLFVVPILLGLLFAVWLYALRPEGWAVLLGCLCLLPGLLLLDAPLAWSGTWVGMTAVLIISHRADLNRRPVVRRRK